MKVKELIEKLKTANQDAEVEVDMTGYNDENEFIKDVDFHHANVVTLVRE